MSCLQTSDALVMVLAQIMVPVMSQLETAIVNLDSMVQIVLVKKVRKIKKMVTVPLSVAGKHFYPILIIFQYTLLFYQIEP